MTCLIKVLRQVDFDNTEGYSLACNGEIELFLGISLTVHNLS